MIDARIPLGVRPVEIAQPDPIRQYASLAQLEGLQTQGRLGALQLRQAQREEEEYVMLRDAFKGADTSTPEGRTALVEKVASINPGTGMKLATNLASMAKEQRAAEKADLEMRKQRTEYVGQLAGAVLQRIQAAQSPEEAAAIYRNGVDFAASQGFPVGQWPQEFTPDVIPRLQQLRAQALDVGKQIDTEYQAKQFDLDERRLAETQRGHDITMRGQDLGVETAQAGRQITMRGQDIAASAQDRAARTQAAGRVDAARIQADQAAQQLLMPSAEERKRLTDITVGLRNIDAIETQLASTPQLQEVLGPLFSENPQAALKRKFGAGWEATMTPEQRQFIAEVSAMTAETRHALFGAALTEGERQSAQQFLPMPEDSPATMAAKLRAGRAWLQRKEAGTLESMQQVGVRTQRSAQPPPIAPAPGAASPAQPGPPATTSNVITEADIAATMQGSGRSRDEVIAALKAKGYTIEGQ